MLRNKKIAVKFPLLITAFAFLATLTVSTVTYQFARTSMIEGAEGKFRALLSSRIDSLLHHFAHIESDALLHAGSEFFVSALKEFSES